MFDLIRLGTMPPVPPIVASRFNGIPADIRRPLRPDRVFSDAVPAVGLVPALAERPASVGVFVFHDMVVEDFAVALVSENLASPDSPATYGMVALDPVRDVQIVDVLFDNVVTTQPRVVVPVAHLVLHLAFDLGMGLARLPDAAVVPIHAHRQDVADRARFEAVDGFQILGLVVSLQADADFQILLFGVLIGGQYAADARAIHAERFLGEDVLARLNGGLEMNRSEPRRSRQNDQVDRTRQKLFVGIEAVELVFGLDSHPLGLRLELPLEVPQAALQLVFKSVGHGDKLNVALRRERLVCRPGSTSATTHKADANLVASAGESPRRKRPSPYEARADSGGGRRLHPVPALGAFIHIRCHGKTFVWAR